MNAKIEIGCNAELPGLPDWPAQVQVINRRGQPIAAGETEDAARANAAARLAADRQRRRSDRAWRAERRNDPAWGWVEW